MQAKVGTTKFAAVYNQIRQSVLGVRRERKVARVLQASTHPEAAAKRKMQRNVVKKDSRKRKERGFLYVPTFFTSHSVQSTSHSLFITGREKERSNDVERNRRNAHCNET